MISTPTLEANSLAETTRPFSAYTGLEKSKCGNKMIDDSKIERNVLDIEKPRVRKLEIRKNEEY